MKNLYIALFAFIFAHSQVFGQSRLCTEVQQARYANVNFKNITIDADLQSVPLKMLHKLQIRAVQGKNKIEIN